MILLLDCGSSKTPYIASIIDEYMDVTTIPVLDFDSSSLNQFSGVVISGAPILVTEQEIDPFLQAIHWIKEYSIPVLGICFGHQLIGISFGAEAYRMREDRDWQTIEAFEDCLLTDKLPTEFEMMEDHCETISIPPGFQLVASSDTCVNEIMQHKEKPIYGVQFHPEVSGNYGAILIGNFVNSCSKTN